MADAAPQHSGGFDSTSIHRSPVKMLFPVKYAPVLNFAIPLSVVKHSDLLGTSQLSLVLKLKNQKNRLFVPAKPLCSIPTHSPSRARRCAGETRAGGRLLGPSDEHCSISSGPLRRVWGSRCFSAPRGLARAAWLRAAQGRAGAAVPARLPSPPVQGRSYSQCQIPNGDVTPSLRRGRAASCSEQADTPSMESWVKDHKMMSKYFPFQIFKQQPAEPSVCGWQEFPLCIQHLSHSCPRSSGARPH